MENKKENEMISEKIKPQVPGITTYEEKIDRTTQIKNEELFFRAIGDRQ